jgi:hypothetical protein
MLAPEEIGDAMLTICGERGRERGRSQELEGARLCGEARDWRGGKYDERLMTPCQRMYPLLSAGTLTGHGQLSVQDGSDEWIASASLDEGAERGVKIRFSLQSRSVGM